MGTIKAKREALNILKDILDRRARGDNDTKHTFPKGTKIYGAGRHSKVFCTATGHYRRCGIEGCGCLRIRAVWAPGTVGNTKPRVVYLAREGLVRNGGPLKKDWRIR